MESTTVPKLSSSARQLRTHGRHEGHPGGLGPSLNQNPSRGCCLRRQWTLCKQRPLTTAALPFPFMEIQVSVVETLDLLRSSVEEEVVFQAAMQVPAHHALACRIEAYDTVFASAPALKAEPHQLTEADRQFASCLASPPEVEEMHTVSTTETSTVGQRQAPGFRAASGLLTLSFSMRNRKDSQELDKEPNSTCTDATGESCMIPDDTKPSDQTLKHSDILASRQHQRQASMLVLHRMSSVNHAGHSFIQQLQPWQEEEQQHVHSSHSTTAAITEGEATSAEPLEQDEASFNRALSSIPRRGMVRLESIGAAGRRAAEVPLATSHSSQAIACLLGVGYMLLHAWQCRMAPAAGLLQAQLPTTGAAGARNRLAI